MSAGYAIITSPARPDEVITVRSAEVWHPLALSYGQSAFDKPDWLKTGYARFGPRVRYYLQVSLKRIDTAKLDPAQ